jgi:hypothetical protein
MQVFDDLRTKPDIQPKEGTMKTSHTAKHLFLGILFFGVLFLCMAPTVLAAGEQSGSVDRSDVVLAEELHKRIGGWVCVTLNSGETFCGKVMKERDGLVHLSKVQERKFPDVLVRISDISLLGVRFKPQED